MRGSVCSSLAMLLLLVTPLAGGESGRTLIENSAGFDGKTVNLRGEVIGVMMKGDFAWVNVLDNGDAIGVWCRASDARKVTVIGDYRHVGDMVEAVGTFHMACSKHGGDLDIHADRFAVVVAGRELDRSPSLPVVALSVVLVGAVILVALLRRMREEKESTALWLSH